MSGSTEHDSETLPSEMRRLVDRLRDEFREEWGLGGRPRIEQFVEGLGPLEAAAVLKALIAIEIDLRIGAGDRPTIGEFAARFPDATELVETAFATAKGVTEVYSTPGVSPLETAVEDGQAAPTEWGGEATSSESPDREGRREPPPRKLGRYQIVRFLGKGSFGSVYLARDVELDRDVAIKVPTARALGTGGQLEALLAEARLAAGLRHPAIVGVHDVGRDGGGTIFIVLEYVKGTTLSDLMDRGSIVAVRLAELIARIADAADYAHGAGLVHRDLKPSNIMIDEQGQPRVADFGLALTEALRRDKAGEIAGTPAYMAPEQVRGEAHRLDGRTDVWALGVILYRGLTGRLPFDNPERGVLFYLILQDEPRAPRHVDEAIPRELERICLKCLSKRMTDRYPTARELAEDLRHWLSGAQGPSKALGPDALRVVPKGLRAFDGDDADFFLALLPGPRGRDGMPESLRFWKAWAEGRDDDPSRAAGLLYGPSGTGKSSMVRAGLLPALGGSVRPIYVEATRDQTEPRLLAALRRAFPALDRAGDLSHAASMLREGQAGAGDRKTLIVLDQFEQWLQGDIADPEAELVRALRHCDGQLLQVLILVRDDFWMPITRFFKSIEVAVVEGRNSAAAELFDPAHARRVLAEFGRACGQIPGGPGGPGPEASAFLDRAVAILAGPGGGIPPVHLSVFYEVVRKRPWTPATVRGLGGVEGIGMTFLGEAFDARASPPSYRVHRDAAQSVLRSLLPAPGSVLRGGLRSARELREVSGYAERPDDFADLIRILDSELRTITPIHPIEEEAGAGTVPGGAPLVDGGPSYQLAHEFLITPIRQWIERKERATRAGRARIRLATITASWSERPSPQRLASPLEWMGILWHSRPGAWSPDERRMMRAAMRRSFAQAAAAVAVASAVAVVGLRVRDHERSEMLLQRCLKADYAALPDLLPELDRYNDRLRPGLEARESRPTSSPREHRIALLLLYRDRPTGRRAAMLHEWARGAGPDELMLIREALARHPSRAVIDRMRGELRDEAAEPASRLRAACVLARIDPGAVDARDVDGPALMRALLAEERRAIPRWLALLGPAVRVVIPPLGEVCRDRDRDPSVRSIAAEALAEALAARGDAEGLARAVVESRDEASLILREALERMVDRSPALAFFRSVVREAGEARVGRRESDEPARRQARAAIGLAALREPEPLWPLLRHRDDPCLRAVLIDRLANSRLPPGLLLGRLARPGLEPSERQALLLAWAEANRDSVAPPVEASVLELARGLYLNDPDGGVHSAAELVAHRRGGPELPAAWEKQLRRDSPTAPDRRWELGPNGHTLIFLRGPLAFRMGSPEDEPWRLANETPHFRRVDRSIAVATKEVTVEQLRAFNQAHPQDLRHSTEPDCPANNVTWLEAACYCNWLSGLAGLEACYEVGPVGIVINRAEGRGGYRLPTEAEAEFFGRGGTQATYPFGDTPELLPRYAWCWLNSGDLTRPVGRLLPNEFGLFDAQGNVLEWCQDGSPEGQDFPPPYPSGTGERPAPDPQPPEAIDPKESLRVLRGGWSESPPGSVRPAYRHGTRAGILRAFAGFRPVRTLPAGGNQSP